MGRNGCNYIQCKRFFFEEMSNNKFILPREYVLYNIYPNPFNSIINITYGVPKYTNVQIVIFDLSGKQVATLINEFQSPGYHSINWNADSHPSGIYFVKMIAGEHVNAQKLMLIK